MNSLELIRTGSSFDKYYQSLNSSYHKAFNKYLMLHYPLFVKKGESLERRQINLTDYCVSHLGNLQNKRLLEIGCGNGIQSVYIANKFQPEETIGIDLNEDNITLAQNLENNGSNVIFHVDDAHKLEKIEDDSIDVIICIESAFHYPDKDQFLTQVNRVLKEDGEFLIADILAKKYKKRILLGKWKRKMSYHHWTLDQYIDSFNSSSLTIDKTDNITKKVIKGYNGYMGWINRRDVGSGIRYYLIQIFIFIQVNLNLILLRRRRHYMIFAGRKLATRGIPYSNTPPFSKGQ
jgi:ubiquinone/menaquinone biosynthesis C-methylase UbiE